MVNIRSKRFRAKISTLSTLIIESIIRGNKLGRGKRGGRASLSKGGAWDIDTLYRDRLILPPLSEHYPKRW